MKVEKNKIRFTPFVVDAKVSKDNYAEFEVINGYLFYDVNIDFSAYDLVEESIDPMLPNKYEWNSYSSHECGNVKLDSIQGISLTKLEHENDKEESLFFYEVTIIGRGATIRISLPNKEEAQELRKELNKLLFDGLES